MKNISLVARSLIASSVGFVAVATTPALAAAENSTSSSSMEGTSPVEMSMSGYSYNSLSETMDSQTTGMPTGETPATLSSRRTLKKVWQSAASQELAFRFALQNGWILRPTMSLSLAKLTSDAESFEGQTGSFFSPHGASLAVGTMSESGYEYGAFLALNFGNATLNLKDTDVLKTKSDTSWVGGYLVAQKQISPDLLGEVNGRFGVLYSKQSTTELNAGKNTSEGTGFAYTIRANIYTPVAKNLLIGAGASVSGLSISEGSWEQKIVATADSEALAVQGNMSIQSLAWQVSVANLRWKF